MLRGDDGHRQGKVCTYVDVGCCICAEGLMRPSFRGQDELLKLENDELSRREFRHRVAFLRTKSISIGSEWAEAGTLDTLHVVHALHSGCSRFLSFDNDSNARIERNRALLGMLCLPAVVYIIAILHDIQCRDEAGFVRDSGPDRGRRHG